MHYNSQISHLQLFIFRLLAIFSRNSSISKYRLATIAM